MTEPNSVMAKGNPFSITCGDQDTSHARATWVLGAVKWHILRTEMAMRPELIFMPGLKLTSI